MIDLQEGWSYVRNSRWLQVSIFCLSLANMGIAGPLFVTMPKLVYNTYGQGAWFLGLINSASPIGSLLALLLVGQAKRLKRRGLFAYLVLLLEGTVLIIFGLPWPHTAFFIIGPMANIMFGFSVAFFNTIWRTILQEMIPSDKLGRVTSLDMLGSFALIPVSEVLGGIFTDRLGAPTVFILGGLLTLLTNSCPLLMRNI